MSRTHEFLVRMVVADDDQTDPHDMVEILEDVLNDRHNGAVAWHHNVQDMTPESRGRWEVICRE